MPALPASLQPSFRGVFDRLFAAAAVTARQTRRGVDEVDWIEKLHALIGVSLDIDLRAHVRAAGLRLSVSAQSVLAHGNPFQVRPEWRHARSVEIGDLLLVSDLFDETRAFERQALLLQMKVGEPKLSRSRVSGTTAQAKLYAAWPPVTWSNDSMRRRLPGAFPRIPVPRPTRAAQFGVIPSRAEARGGWLKALPLTYAGGFGQPRDLADEVARVIRLDLGVDATPDRSNGWPRIVQDMLREAGLREFRALPRLLPDDASTHRKQMERGRGGQGAMLALKVTFGPPGWFD